MTFLKTKSLLSVSLYLSNITANDVATAFSASILIMAPSVFLFACGQDYLEQGILASGLKAVSYTHLTTVVQQKEAFLY